MMHDENLTVSRKWLYFAMLVLLAAIFIGAKLNAPPIYLAVGFIGEIILVSTAHLSSVLQHYTNRIANDRQSP